jgi:hypothetical protein
MYMHKCKRKNGLNLHAKITALILHYVFFFSLYIFERLFQIKHNLIFFYKEYLLR